MPVIKNDAELTSMLKSKLLLVFDVLEDVIYKKVRESIMKNTYKSHKPNTWYYAGDAEPTWEFYNAWDWEGHKITARQITNKFFFDWESMDADAQLWKHGSRVKGWPDDVREPFADIMNRDGFSSSLGMSRYRRPFWDIVMKELFGNKLIEKMFEQECARVGLILRKG